MDTGGFAAIATVAQWLRCAHSGTALSADERAVTSAWEEPAGRPGSDASAGPAGLAVGPGRTALHAVPEEGRIVRLPWRPEGRLTAPRAEGGLGDGPFEDLLEVTPAPGTPSGEFAMAPGAARRQMRAVSLAMDAYDRMTVLDATDGSVLVIDLADRRTVRRFRPPGTPVDLAPHEGGVLIACAEPDAPLWRLNAWDAGPRPFPVPAGPREALPAGAVPSRVAVGPGSEVWLLWRDTDGDGWAVPVADERTSRAIGPVPSARDLELDGTSAVIVASGPGADLRRFAFLGTGRTTEQPLRAPGYDGRGLTRTPDGRIGYWNGKGVRIAFAAPARYRTAGRIDTFALDSGVHGQRWGRLFVDACLPPGTSLAVGCLTADALPTDEGVATLSRTPPANVEPDLPASPPGPPLAPFDSAELLFEGEGAEFGSLYRRGPREVPWTRRSATDRYATYETVVNAPPGRYLWLRLRLTGTPTVAPRVRALRVERSGHGLLDRLPDLYSAEPRAAAFLDRYLALLGGPLADLDARAAERHLVLDPAAAPAELLPWLASLVGLTLDGRWPEVARRTLLAEAVELFRARGTVAGLTRMLEIYLGVRPTLVERFRFRGLGAAAGAGAFATEGSFDAHAHRFSVVVPGTLSEEQLETVRHLVDVHRPAHTLVEVCTADRGARVGVGWHLGLTSVVGRDSGFRQLAVGGALGPGAVLGRPTGGTAVGEGRIGADLRVAP
ncbi:phage tail protein [Streptomyces coerulescens]|uniref:Phage tail protein n=1 Tax=Streptomyces coerulescens TaxID=29304 RepID=A0ABW0CX49_STRCD